MKLAYISSVSYADTDFPLIREYQRLGHDVRFFISLPCFSLRSTLIDIKEQDPRSEILPASTYRELDVYKDYIDLSKVYIINRTEQSELKLSTLSLSVKLNRLLTEFNPDVIHILGPFSVSNSWLYFRWRKKMVLTMHDPFPHSGENSFRRTFFRNLAFKCISRFILLNQKQLDQFAEIYNIDKKNILVNKIGKFDYFDYFQTEVKKIPHNILFFGRISPYKGLEYLCQAMLKVHEQVPDATLTIAGGGKMYFDITPYENLPYIEIHNHYVGMQELAGYISKCSVTVCPYTDATQSGVILTSFSLGKPVVATNVGALGEMVEDGKTGVLVPPKDVTALADALIDILRNDSIRNRMSEELCSAYFQDGMAWNCIAAKYLEFYQKDKSTIIHENT